MSQSLWGGFTDARVQESRGSGNKPTLFERHEFYPERYNNAGSITYNLRSGKKIMSENGNVFTWFKVSAQLVTKRNQNKAKIDAQRLNNKNKRLPYPSYEEACILYAEPKSIEKPQERFIAETSLLVTPGALECGYSQCIDWTAGGILDDNIYKWIGWYARTRLRLAGTCVEISQGKAFKMRDFYQCIESSEKATISFILGGFFCYQSATYWLTFRHEQIANFIHAGLIKKASLTFYPDEEKRKTPDYLIETHKGKWHVFESKGGGHSSRWQRIEEAVKQLESVTHVVRKDGTPEKIKTFVCTHTSIDADKDIAINVVDPVSDRVQPLIINPDVCILLSKLTLISLFDALSAIETSSKYEIEGMDDWAFVHAPEYDGVQFGIPKKYLEFKNEIKSSLGIYLALKEVIDLKLIENNETGYFKEGLIKLAELFPSRTALRNVIQRVKPTLVQYRKITENNYGHFLKSLADSLALQPQAERILLTEFLLVDNLPEPIKKHLSPWGGLTRTAPLPGYDDPWSTPKSKSSNRPKKPSM
ncbi:hypothetical protein VZ119_11830 [Enterobacter bugandensis]|uniref:hypothetical protein n=1 Tax=Enterobacter bugandensis TaxID=881260 RepID=UPI002E28EE1A|nr:hypothetical protein [Enterobacter bugandensis]MED5643192.1 hypothetical protein [Enterobacter bugandensis]